MRNTDFHLYYVWLWLDLQKMNVWLNQRGRSMRGGIVRFTHNSALFHHLDLIEYSVLHYAATQTNISYRQSCILCEMHLKFNRADS